MKIEVLDHESLDGLFGSGSQRGTSGFVDLDRLWSSPYSHFASEVSDGFAKSLTPRRTSCKNQIWLKKVGMYETWVQFRDSRVRRWSLGHIKVTQLQQLQLRLLNGETFSVATIQDARLVGD